MSERVPIEVTRQDRIYCLKASSDYHSELCEECRFYPNCDHTTQDDLTELTIKDLEVLEQEPTTKNDLGVDCISRAQVQTEIEMNASRYTIAKERGGMGQVEWSDQLIKVSDAIDIIRNLPPITPQEPFINKACVSSKVCEHDKEVVLDKIRAEMLEEMIPHSGTGEEVIQAYADGLKKGLEILDKYKAESEGE